MTRQVGQVVEELIQIKDEFFNQMSVDQRNALNDACNLLSNILGDFTKYDYKCELVGKKVSIEDKVD